MSVTPVSVSPPVATVYGFIITELITNKTLSFAFQGLGLK